MSSVLKDESSFNFPGPLLPSHKEKLIDFTNLKIQTLEDADSLILWKLLLLLIKTDSALLRENWVQNHSLLEKVLELLKEATVAKVRNPGFSQASLEIIEETTRHLLYGNTKEAVHEAMKGNCWDHALAIAFSDGPSSFLEVLYYFVKRGFLDEGHPLATFYMQLTGALFDENNRTEVRLRHWKQHVAILLVNRSDRLKYFLMTLGDRLYNESINASHFCYLLSGDTLKPLHQKTRMTLLGTHHKNFFYPHISAIEKSEILEFAHTLLDSSFLMPHLLPFKFMHAIHLAELGNLSLAIRYCEYLQKVFLSYPEICTSLWADKFLIFFKRVWITKLYKNPSSVADLEESFDQNVILQEHSFSDMCNLAKLSELSHAYSSTPEPYPTYSTTSPTPLINPNTKASLPTSATPAHDSNRLDAGLEELINENYENDDDFFTYYEEELQAFVTEQTQTKEEVTLANERLEKVSFEEKQPVADNFPLPEQPTRTISAEVKKPEDRHERKSESMFSDGLFKFIKRKLGYKEIYQGKNLESYYDKNLGRWVFPGGDDEETEEAGPPIVSTRNNSVKTQKDSIGQSRRRRKQLSYVDPW
ncbi:protein transport protein Sec16B-like [Zophobas morio]|uniref:protein transport protein Sec16B-like n=1 Tax=Zophobas morio TaxID=2755281 RepID=UPI00308290DE